MSEPEKEPSDNARREGRGGRFNARRAQARNPSGARARDAAQEAGRPGDRQSPPRKNPGRGALAKPRRDAQLRPRGRNPARPGPGPVEGRAERIERIAFGRVADRDRSKLLRAFSQARRFAQGLSDPIGRSVCCALLNALARRSRAPASWAAAPRAPDGAALGSSCPCPAASLAPVSAQGADQIEAHDHPARAGCAGEMTPKAPGASARDAAKPSSDLGLLALSAGKAATLLAWALAEEPASGESRAQARNPGTGAAEPDAAEQKQETPAASDPSPSLGPTEGRSEPRAIEPNGSDDAGSASPAAPPPSAQRRERQGRREQERLAGASEPEALSEAQAETETKNKTKTEAEAEAGAAGAAQSADSSPQADSAPDAAHQGAEPQPAPEATPGLASPNPVLAENSASRHPGQANGGPSPSESADETAAQGADPACGDRADGRLPEGGDEAKGGLDLRRPLEGRAGKSGSGVGARGGAVPTPNLAADSSAPRKTAGLAPATALLAIQSLAQKASDEAKTDARAYDAPQAERFLAGCPVDRAVRLFLSMERALEAKARFRPRLEWPSELPVSERIDDLKAAIAANQCVVVTGATGSGKSTQLPKILMSMGYGLTSQIAHTQPRRIAARSIARRVADETLGRFGEEIGFKVRFQNQTTANTFVCVMTDGVLLNEIKLNPNLEGYGAIIVDEAHERSLNIDFLLGYLKRLAAKRPELKIIVTSATIDAEKLSAFFGGAPTLSVEGKTYPVEVAYRPLGDDELGDSGDSLAFGPDEDADDDAEGDGAGEDDNAESAGAQAGLEGAGFPAQGAPGLGNGAAGAQGGFFSQALAGALSGAQINAKLMLAAGASPAPTTAGGGAPAPKARRKSRAEAAPGALAQTRAQGDGAKGKSDDEGAEEPDLSRAILDALDELYAAFGEGDALVFLPGEREIHEAQRLIEEAYENRRTVLPLFSRMSEQSQDEIFRPKGGRSRVILATNVAETSITVPNIRYVVDSGLARVNRYSAKAKVEQLHVEKISRASADQRAGRCGRVGPGVCVRLYSKADYDSRPQYADPEILRSNLSSVALRMLDLELGPIAEFPLLDAPSERLVRDGYQTLFELAAVDKEGRLTDVGRKMARFPVDPKISRILIEAAKLGVSEPALTVASALGAQDPRLRPFGEEARADKAHEPFSDKDSDFMGYLWMWDFWLKARRNASSRSALSRLAQRRFLSVKRLRDWEDLRKQLGRLCEEAGLYDDGRTRPAPADGAGSAAQTPKAAKPQGAKAGRGGKTADAAEQRAGDGAKVDFSAKDKSLLDAYEPLHKAILAGLIANVGVKGEDGRQYLGARGSKFWIFPGSGLKKSKPAWIVTHELVDTARLYARCVGRIEPEWVESVAPHLIKLSFFEPHWSDAREEAMASERATLYGLTVVARRPTRLSGKDPALARELLIREGLCQGRAKAKPDFLRHNLALLEEIEDIGERSRKIDAAIDEEALFRFYDEKLPQDCLNMASVRAWAKKEAAQGSRGLYLRESDLMERAAREQARELYPPTLKLPDGDFELAYRFEPGHPLDGVTLKAPLGVINRLPAGTLEWLVPGMEREKIEAILKSLPKTLRRVCQPLRQSVTDFLESEPDKTRSLYGQLAQFVAKRAGEADSDGLPPDLDVEQWRRAPLPAHLRLNIAAIGPDGQEIDSDRDLPALRLRLGEIARDAFRDDSDKFEIERVERWDFGDVAAPVEFSKGRRRLAGYLGLREEDGGALALRLFDTRSARDAAHGEGVLRLAEILLPRQAKDLRRGLPSRKLIALSLAPDVDEETLREDEARAAMKAAFYGVGESDAPIRPPLDKESFERALGACAKRLPEVKIALDKKLSAYAAAHAKVRRALAGHPLAEAVGAQLAQLCYPGFVENTPWEQWDRMAVYMAAALARIEKYSGRADKDAQWEEAVQRQYERWCAELDKIEGAGLSPSSELMSFYWDIQELRVSLFAQELKTPRPVSEQRLDRKWASIPKTSAP